MFGENLLNLRRAYGMTQTNLAMELGITKQAVSNWENGITVPSTEMLRKISRLFSVSIESLLGEKENYISVEGLTPGQIFHIQLLINDMKQMQ